MREFLHHRGSTAGPALGPLRLRQAHEAMILPRGSVPCSGLTGFSCHLAVDEQGSIVRVEGVGRDLWAGWEPRTGEPLAAFLDRWDPVTSADVERARVEHRSVTGDFVATLASRRCLCSLDYVPTPRTLRGDLWLAVLLEADPTTDRLFELALKTEDQAHQGRLVLAELNQDRELKDGLSGMLPHLLRVLNMDAGAVFVVRDVRTAELAAIHGPTQQRGYPYRDLDLTDARIAPLAQRPRLIELLPEDPIQPALRGVMVRNLSLGLLAPASAGHSVTAYVAVSSSRTRALGLNGQRILSTVCEALGPIVRSHALSAESRRDAAVRNSSQAVFHTISQSLELDQTYKEIAANAVGAVSGSSCLLMELQSETGELITVASSEAEASSLIGLRVRFADGQGLTESLKSKRSMVIDDLVAGAGVNSEAKALLSLRSTLLVPVLAHGELIGALMLYSVGRRTRYSERDMRRAEEVAEQAAIAIHNARLYRDLVHSRESIQELVHRISQIRQDERQAFAGVVHDDIVQSVVGARYLLESFQRTHPEQAGEHLNDAVQVLQQTVVDARRIIWELRPPILDELGLEASLKGLEHHLESARGSAVIRTEIGRLPTLNREMATALYKVAREATLNATRHAHARHIWIRLLESRMDEKRAVRLNVQDDGIGFDVSGLDKETHFGCAMMEEQATVVGGRLLIE
jgi:signal transduction histidine kinase